MLYVALLCLNINYHDCSLSHPLCPDSDRTKKVDWTLKKQFPYHSHPVVKVSFLLLLLYHMLLFLLWLLLLSSFLLFLYQCCYCSGYCCCQGIFPSSLLYQSCHCCGYCRCQGIFPSLSHVVICCSYCCCQGIFPSLSTSMLSLLWLLLLSRYLSFSFYISSCCYCCGMPCLVHFFSPVITQAN